MSFTINGAFLREEILDGAIGLELDAATRQLFADASDAELDGLVDTVFGMVDHPIHDALSCFVRTAVELKPADRRLTLVAFAPASDYEQIVDQANDNGGSTTAVAEALLSSGTLTRTECGFTLLGNLKKQRNSQLHEVDIGDTCYWLRINHQQCFYMLYKEVAATAAPTSGRPPRSVRTDTGERTGTRIDPGLVTLVWRDRLDREYDQSLADLPEVGTLIDPDTGDDLELAGTVVASAPWVHAGQTQKHWAST